MADFVADSQIHGYSVGGRKKKDDRRKTGTTYRINWVVSVLSSFLFLLSSFFSSAQSPKAKELYVQSIKLFGNRKAEEAIPFMEQAVKVDPAYGDAYLKLGQLYEFTKRFDPAIVAYRDAIKLAPDNPTSSGAYQSLSTILMRLGRYTDALPYLEKYQSLFAPKSLQHQRVGKLLANARFGVEAMQHPQPVEPKPVSPVLNTTPSQYFPVLTADEQTLVFTALKPEGDEDLMVATFNGETWSPPVSLSPNINTLENEGTATLSADGRTLVFTACQGRKGFGSCDLYMSRKTGSDWSVPENLGAAINTRYYESQPSLSADGRRLYFISDRPGGKGRRDIWRADLNTDGSWSEPTNIGAPVNTSANEASPFIHANGQSLFFASEGHTGLGGYDLFVSDSLAVIDSTHWSTPTNLGYPINTSEDQASLFVAANGRRAYYSYEEQKDGVSQRSRLYAFDLPETLRDRVKPVSYVKGVVADARTSKPLAAMVELIDLKTNQLVSRVMADAQTGQYTAILPSGGEYALYVSVPGYLFKSLSFDFTQKAKDDPRSASTGLSLPVPLEPAVSGATAKETLNNLFFETGRYDLADKSRTELDRLAQFLKINPGVAIEISGHTDDRGDAAANLTLSKKRAQSVVTYLTQAGISAERIKAVGYGKARPLVPNTTDENRQLNRRIEWRVL
ncbi:tetratricopeptide repeat protein [Spirosoma oryzae]|uniref:Tetratricopeptide repeat protein n=1 Tax=Spirosoma oryzae TaxID=1469603 RepID=A0A2T0SLY9_9BACT|nr:OmpA family protein [Spirosoma oryzae]PRY34418.1 tetratricopeptide repeat protein [Spirosoma oryzae]